LNTWIALLRGVNVVGSRKLLMKDLAAMLTRAGFGAVRTYIASGNVVFRSTAADARALEARIAKQLRDEAGFETRVLVLSCAELTRAIRDNPFAQADEDHKSLHLFFLAEEPPKPNLEALRRLRSGGDAFALKARVFYLYTPQGFPDSALHDKVERFLGVAATARNWRTARQLLSMSAQGAETGTVAAVEAVEAPRRKLRRRAAALNRAARGSGRSAARGGARGRRR
jgi:uncharacterized protein (DUF1697 family)